MSRGPAELKAMPLDRADPRDQAQARPARKRAATVEFVPRQRILLVEDDFMLRQHLAELLAAEGYYVSSAADGAEALWRLEREPLPSAILLDLVLPKMNGISFREAQLQSPVLREIPTIVMSATRGVRDLGPLNFCEILPKPVPFDRLVEALARVCPSA